MPARRNRSKAERSSDPTKAKRKQRGRANTDIGQLITTLRSLAARPRANFFELGELLAAVQDDHPDRFGDIIGRAGIGRRRGYYLMEVRRCFMPFMRLSNRLKAIGWTKLRVLAPIVTEENLEELLQLAESMSAQQLSSIARGAEPQEGTRCVLLYLTPDQHRRFEGAVLAHGGARRGRQLMGQENALMSILAAATPSSADD